MRKILLDTNLLVSYSVGEAPVGNECKHLISLAAQKKIQLFAALHSMKDIYYITARRLKQLEIDEVGFLSESSAMAAKEAAWASIKQIGRQVHIISEGRNEHEHAFVYRTLHNDYEDNLVLAAAHAAKVDLLITNDVLLRQHSPVAALSSAEAVALLNAEFAPRKD